MQDKNVDCRQYCWSKECMLCYAFKLLSGKMIIEYINYSTLYTIKLKLHLHFGLVQKL